MKVSKTLERSLTKHFSAKCRSCTELRSAPNKGKNVKFWCNQKNNQFPFAKKCEKWKAEWDEGTQNVTIGDHLAKQFGLITPSK